MISLGTWQKASPSSENWAFAMVFGAASIRLFAVEFPQRVPDRLRPSALRMSDFATLVRSNPIDFFPETFDR